MKHPTKISLTLLCLFLIIELFGLFCIGYFYSRNSLNELDVEPREKTNFFYSLIIGFIIITILFLVLIVFKKNKIMSLWYYLSLFFAYYFTLNIFLNSLISFAMALSLLSLRKSKFRNITEFFVYPGIVVIMIPLFDINHILILMTLFALYDFISVRITKHMILLAKGQLSNSIFSGIKIDYYVPPFSNGVYDKSNTVRRSSDFSLSVKKVLRRKAAILGGGDIAFPMLFSGWLLVNISIKLAILAVLGAFVGLAVIFFRSENKFYPALPYLVFFMFLFVSIGLIFN